MNVWQKKTNLKKIATPTHHATTQKNATFWSVTFIYKMVWESLRCLGRWDRNISRTSSQCFGSFASLHHTHQPFYTFLDSSSAPQKHLKVPSLLQSFTIEATTFLWLLLTHHIQKLVQTCTPFRPVSSDPNIDPVPQPKQHLRDPKIQD